MIELLVLIGILTIPLAAFVIRAWRSRSVAPLLEALRGVLAGAAAGVLWGIGARGAMRAVALAAGDRTEFTVGGTAMILVAGAILGAVLGLIFAAVRRWLPGNGADQGSIAGSFLLVFLLLPLTLFGPVEIDRVGLVGLSSFGTLFIIFGASLGALLSRLDRRLLPRRTVGGRRAAAATGGADRRLPSTEPVL